MREKWELAGIGVTITLAIATIIIAAWRRQILGEMMTPDATTDLSTAVREIKAFHDKFTSRRNGDFFDKWAEDLAARKQEKGTASAVFQGLGDVLTLGGSARQRQKKNELQAAAYLAHSVDNVMTTASNNLRIHVASTARRIEYGFKLLERSERLTNPVIWDTFQPIYPGLAGQLASIQTRACNLRTGSSAFLDVAVAAGAGGATAIGLWGAVQLAGYASTGTAMAGLHGAAASSAGWAWFGGGSLATGGGGMALGHVLLPGVGAAVAWTVFVSRLHEAATEMEGRIKEIEESNEKNMPVLYRLVNVTERYAEGSEAFRISLNELHREANRAEKALRPFGTLSDWRRRRRVKQGLSYYSPSEMDLVERLALAVDQFLERLPASNTQS